MARRFSYALAILSGVLQVGSFPWAGTLPFWREGLAWIALVPLLVALLLAADEGKGSLWFAARLGYLCGIIFYLGNCSWIYQTIYLYGGLPKPLALLILLLFAFYLGLYHALFAVFVACARQAFGTGAAIVLAPLAWVAVELARARVTGFPWDLLGYSQIDNSLLLRLAPLAGVMAISFVLAAVNAVFTFGLVSFEKLTSKLPDRQGSIRMAFWGVGFFVVGCVMFLGRPAGIPYEQPGEVALLLQENLSVGVAAQSNQPASLREELAEFSGLSLNPPAKSLRDRNPTLVVWPEAPSHLLANDQALQAVLGSLARQVHAPLIIGSIGVEENASSQRGYFAYDSAAFFDKAGTYQGRYDKIHLVPWGEYVPYKSVFSFAQKLTEGVGDMEPGTARTLFHADGHRYGVFICYESIFGDEVRQFVREGAEVLVNISDDGWYGDTGAPWQHLNMARMRAVENHRWLIRDTNTGETTVIDPEGHYTETERHRRTAYVLPFAFETGTTFYTRHGDWFAYLCALATLLAFGYGLLRRPALK